MKSPNNWVGSKKSDLVRFMRRHSRILDFSGNGLVARRHQQAIILIRKNSGDPAQGGTAIRF
jgi:hypothetical protein